MTSERKIKLWLYFFIFALVISGLTAFPLEWELAILNNYFGLETATEEYLPGLSMWITKIHAGLA